MPSIGLGEAPEGLQRLGYLAPPPPNKPLKLTAAGFSCAGGRARHASW